MRIIKLRTAQENTFWLMDNIHLTPFEDTSKPFDFDEVYEEGRQRIYTSANVTGKIQIIEIGSTKETLINVIPSKEPVYELPGQQYQHVPRIMTVAVDDIEREENYRKEGTAKKLFQSPPSIYKEEAPTEEDMKHARKLMMKKVTAIEIVIKDLSMTKESRRFLLGCMTVENKYKKRKSVLDILEEKYLSIPPEGE